MGPVDADSTDRDTKLASKPLSGSELFQLWRWPIIMGCKSKDLSCFLEDMPEDINLNFRKESRHESALAQAFQDLQLAVNDDDVDERILDHITNSSGLPLNLTATRMLKIWHLPMPIPQ